jgi:hypothetical protein
MDRYVESSRWMHRAVANAGFLTADDHAFHGESGLRDIAVAEVSAPITRQAIAKGK